MNLYFRYSAIVILFFAIITSCKKTSDDAPRDPDKLRISRIVQSTISSGSKSENIISFVYDDQQRVDKIISSRTNFSDTTTYFYNGSDKKPYKSNSTISFYGSTADTYYTYDNTGVLISDSVGAAGTYGIDKFTRNYRYSAGRIIVKNASYHHLNATVVDFYESTDSILVYNANITTVINLPASPSDNGTFYRYIYDDKINPISKLNIAAVKVTAGIPGFPNRTASGICNNNIIEYNSGTYSRLGLSTTQSVQKYLYTYTREGLPETCEIRFPTSTNKYQYYYEAF